MTDYIKDLLKELNQSKHILVKRGDWVEIGMRLIKMDVPFTVIPNGDLGTYIDVKCDFEI